MAMTMAGVRGAACWRRGRRSCPTSCNYSLARPSPSLCLQRARDNNLHTHSLQQNLTLEAIQKSGVIACLRAQSGELALESACKALDEGISVLEITMTTPRALEVIAELVQGYPSAVIGAGTVLTREDAKNAELAGARFLMSPATVKDILDSYKDGPILYIPGAMTPTEVLNAHAFGAKIVKIYPVTVLGGEQYIRALKSPFHHIPMVASQGITMDSVELYISMGASAVVLSDAIFNKSAMSIRDFGVIKKLAGLAALKGAAAVERCFCSST